MKWADVLEIHGSVVVDDSAYAQKYKRELKERNATELPESENREKALDNLRKALEFQPDFAKTVKEEWVKPAGSFYSLAKDKEFLKLVEQAISDSESDADK